MFLVAAAACLLSIFFGFGIERAVFVPTPDGGVIIRSSGGFAFGGMGGRHYTLVLSERTTTIASFFARLTTNEIAYVNNLRAHPAKPQWNWGAVVWHYPFDVSDRLGARMPSVVRYAKIPGESATHFELPLWVILLPAAVWLLILRWRDRRKALIGHCPCGYDLTGNVSGICPECGEKILSPPPAFATFCRRARCAAVLTGLLLCLVSCAAWTWTMRFESAFDLTDHTNLYLSDGYVDWRTHPVAWQLNFYKPVAWRPLSCMFPAPESREIIGMHYVRTPLWLIFLCAAIPTAFLLYRGRWLARRGR